MEGNERTRTSAPALVPPSRPTRYPDLVHVPGSQQNINENDDPPTRSDVARATSLFVGKEESLALTRLVLTTWIEHPSRYSSRNPIVVF